MTSFAIRRATSADIRAAAAFGAEIIKLHHATNPQRFFLPQKVETGYAWWLGRELPRDEAVILVAEQENEVVGYAYGTLEKRDWNILVDRHGVVQDVCVADKARQCGIGRALVAELITCLEAMGAPRILLRTMVQNVSAQRLFASLGFAPTLVEMTRERTVTREQRRRA